VRNGADGQEPQDANDRTDPGEDPELDQRCSQRAPVRRDRCVPACPAFTRPPDPGNRGVPAGGGSSACLNAEIRLSAPDRAAPPTASAHACKRTGRSWPA
jgi:hypothetical protein